ncbi:glycine zipper family protein [Catellatospora tritici]|uniref:glycine zipper family protein n=1 Tax=Catellatospora tritici TaxID=2851566 RepID=UPI001C2DF0D0|nr:glycine zipper family protein [Catellatospora tritici]MBV1850220.1 glycine zipper family protein [Catellatospora tritici]
MARWGYGLGSALLQVGAAALVGALSGLPGAVVAVLAAAAVALPYGWAVARLDAYADTGRGLALFALDHTWSLVNTIAGALFLALNLVGGHRLDPAPSRHRGRIVVREQALPGYATTVGNVIAGLTPGNEAHEDLHVRQGRLLGPLYLPLVALGYVLCAACPLWLRRHDHTVWPITGPIRYFTHGVYPHVWHEAWAYRRDRLARREGDRNH